MGKSFYVRHSSVLKKRFIIKRLQVLSSRQKLRAVERMKYSPLICHRRPMFYHQWKCFFLTNNKNIHWKRIVQHLIKCITLEWISSLNIFPTVLIVPHFFHFQQTWKIFPHWALLNAQFYSDRRLVRGIFQQLSYGKFVWMKKYLWGVGK